MKHLTVEVLENYSACYADPIRVERDDIIHLTGRQDNWNGHIWLWAVASDGREGWVPDTLVEETSAGQRRATQTYSAQELSCTRGEKLSVITKTHGWTWCENSEGGAGWVPDENLQTLS